MNKFLRYGSNIVIFFAKLLGLLLIFLLFVLLFTYNFSAIYDFPSPSKFSGNHFYNPYADTTLKWYKCNFHAHSKAWGGTTNGENTVFNLYDKYDSLGYDIIVVSNYMNVSRTPLNSDLFIPNYEHGYNLFKRHQLPIGAHSILWTDYVFFQTIHHKQDLIKKMRPTTEIITIAHPEFMNSYEPEDFKYLTDYDFIEVYNHFRYSLKHWDTCLSAGRLAWGMGDDDSHDQRKPDETGRFWTMVAAKSKYREDIIAGLKEGRTIPFGGKNGKVASMVKNISVTDSIISISFTGLQDSVKFISDGGITVLKDTMVMKASYRPKLSDSYVRVEAYTKENEMALNPFVRINGEKPVKVSAIENGLLTWIYRIIFFICYVSLVYPAYKIVKKRKKELLTIPKLDK